VGQHGGAVEDSDGEAGSGRVSLRGGVSGRKGVWVKQRNLIVGVWLPCSRVCTLRIRRRTPPPQDRVRMSQDLVMRSQDLVWRSQDRVRRCRDLVRRSQDLVRIEFPGTLCNKKPKSRSKLEFSLRNCLWIADLRNRWVALALTRRPHHFLVIHCGQNGSTH
jgi:hypothetical protein